MTTIELIDRILEGYDVKDKQITEKLRVRRYTLAANSGYVSYYQVYITKGFWIFKKEVMIFLAMKGYSQKSGQGGCRISYETESELLQEKLRRYLDGRPRERDASGADSSYPSGIMGKDLV